MEHYNEYKNSSVKWNIPMNNAMNMNVLDGNALKGQKAHSPGQRPGDLKRDNHALKGQKLNQCYMAFALTGRMYTPTITQGVALGWKLFALSGRHLPTTTM